MATIPIDKSVRFFPHWKPNDSNQVIGLIQMINYILSIDPKASHWVEIGSYIGESATIFLGFDQISKLECIEQSKPLFSMLENKLDEYVKSDRCILHNEASQNCSNLFEDESIDTVYIDGNHEYESVETDIRLYYPKIKQNGFLCGHDYVLSWPGVIKAVDEFNKTKNHKLITFKDSSWLLHKV